VKAELDRPVDSSQTLCATVRTDDLIATRDGRPAAESISYAVDGGTSDRGNARIRNDELLESDGFPKALPVAVEVAPLLPSAAGLSQASDSDGAAGRW
jgi:hypothetical protein